MNGPYSFEVSDSTPCFPSRAETMGSVCAFAASALALRMVPGVANGVDPEAPTHAVVYDGNQHVVGYVTLKIEVLP